MDVPERSLRALEDALEALGRSLTAAASWYERAAEVLQMCNVRRGSVLPKRVPEGQAGEGERVQEVPSYVTHPLKRGDSLVILQEHPYEGCTCSSCEATRAQRRERGTD